MALYNTPNQYSSLTKLLHWLVAICILALVALGFTMGSFKDEHLNDVLFTIHKSIGLTVLMLMVIWIVWRSINIHPSLDHLPLWERAAARFNHSLLCLLLILMPISGLVMSVAAGSPPEYFGLVTLTLPIAKNKVVADYGKLVHNSLAWVIIALVTLHILAAFKHFLFDKDNVMQRMLPRKSP